MPQADAVHIVEHHVKKAAAEMGVCFHDRVGP